MKIKLLMIKCPACHKLIHYKDRLSLVYKGYINCRVCDAGLISSILSSILAVYVLEVPSWLLFDAITASLKLNTNLSYLIGFSVCLLVVKIASPLEYLVQVDVN